MVDAFGVCLCGAPLDPAITPSEFFCSEPCQTEWLARHGSPRAQEPSVLHWAWLVGGPGDRTWQPMTMPARQWPDEICIDYWLPAPEVAYRPDQVGGTVLELPPRGVARYRLEPVWTGRGRRWVYVEVGMRITPGSPAGPYLPPEWL